MIRNVLVKSTLPPARGFFFGDEVVSRGRSATTTLSVERKTKLAVREYSTRITRMSAKSPQGLDAYRFLVRGRVIVNRRGLAKQNGRFQGREVKGR